MKTYKITVVITVEAENMTQAEEIVNDAISQFSNEVTYVREAKEQS